MTEHEVKGSDGAMGHVCPPSVVKFLNSRIRKLFQNPRRIMGEYVKVGATVTDLGCGGGFFTVALAEMVGPSGRVIAVDLQPEMLEITRKFATKRGLEQRIELHRCQADDIDLSGREVDFALAFYMVHEVPDRSKFLSQVADLLSAGSHFLMIEPSGHVTPAQFEQILDEADGAGLRQSKPVKVLMSRGMLFTAT